MHEMTGTETLHTHRNLRLMVVADACLFVGAYLAAYLIRFDAVIPAKHVAVLKATLVPMLLCKMVVAHYFGLYRGMWRYTSLVDLMNVFKAAFVSSLLIYSTVLFLRSLAGFSRGVFLLDGLLTFLFVGGLRVGIRLYFTHTVKRFFARDFYAVQRSDGPKNNLLIIGAGDAGEVLLREFRQSPALSYNVVGLLDDDATKIGRYIHGTPVLGTIDALREIVQLKAVTEVLVAKPTATAREMRRIVEVCEAIDVECRIIPSAGEFIDGNVSITSVRDVAFEDLLGREPVKLETARIGGYLRGKRVLVTGAGGSIGSELCRQVARFEPGALLLADRSESALYDIEMELKHHPTFQVNHKPILVGVQNLRALREVFAEFRPEVVFHAAAYKHVPMLELHPWEAVFNNIVGTKNVLALSNEFEEVGRFVLVSTDKAVRPTSVMGTSKRVAELLTQCYDAINHHTVHQAVRFGNVAGSAGSVIPLFKKQIEKRGAVTVTHPEVTRFFMTITEASQLILQAGAMGSGGEIFILEMGAPIKIVDLARDLIRLSGFEPDVDVPIEFIGLRPGEKLYEELITDGEGIVPTEHQKIMVLKPEQAPLEAVRETFDKLSGDIEELVGLAHAHNGDGIRQKLHQIVPEYAPSADDQSATAPGNLGALRR